jgi:hypothetical protein
MMDDYRDEIAADHKRAMQETGHALSEIFEGLGFALFVFDWHGGRFNYLSNASRDDMLNMLEEFIAAERARQP